MFQHIHLDHVVLRVRDIERMAAFYRAVLGATVERQLDIGLVQLRAGDILIDLVPADSELGRQGGPPPGPGRNVDHFCLRVDPFDEAGVHAHLESLGAAHSETREVYGAEGYGPSIYVTDPEGNVMELKGPATRGL
ncbi:MAG: VOC family protein [Gammaproteobacteria bacterium]|nr:VOC family protein [Gammaproteobacteria bacterium]MCP5199000.1 VOC family protein [Gammaproteobacteria bacterium]